MTNYTLSDFTKNEDEVLGNFYEGVLTVGSQQYGITIYLEGSEAAEVEKSVNRFFANVDNFLQKAKECIAQKYLKLYNDNWRFSDEDEDDDTTKPELTKEEFMQHLDLDTIVFTGDEEVEIFFFDNDMFLGHSLIAGDFDGEQFHYAQMAG